MELAEHLANIKAKKEAWVAEDPQNRWACYPIQEVEHWHQYGIYTVAQYERHCLESEVWDCYKDVYGVRPRYMPIKEMSNEELQQELDSIIEHAEWEREEERIYAHKQMLKANRLAHERRCREREARNFGAIAHFFPDP